MAKLKVGPVRRTLQKQIRAQPAIYLHDIVGEAVAQEKEDAEATVAVTNRYDPAHMKNKVLAPSHTALRELALDVASLKQELSSIKQDPVSSHKGENRLGRDSEEDHKCWQYS